MEQNCSSKWAATSRRLSLSSKRDSFQNMSNETFHVKLVSEAAEYVSISQVMQRDYSLQELIGAMLPVVGRDGARMQQLLRMGGFSNGDYKFRWDGREVSAAEI